MQEIIERIIGGSFDSESAALDFSCAEINISLQKGICYEGNFQISASSDCHFSGHITTSDFRMECLTKDFSGKKVEISYLFHGEYLNEGDEVKGSFYVVSSQGEYYLPFTVLVEHSVLDSSIGPIKNLFHFANLAKSNWQEALRLFYSAGFKDVFKGNDRKYYDSYRGLSVYSGQEQNMEEFLIQINKKQRVEFTIQEPSLELELQLGSGRYDVLEQEILLNRSGWGYTVLNVECDGDFLFAEKELVTDDDFLGNSCRLPVYIDGECCRPGKNFGQVVLYNSYLCLSVPVLVHVKEGANPAGRKQRKEMILQLSRSYQAFRLKKITTAAWLKETGGLVEKILMLDRQDIAARLFKAQLLITEERYLEAERSLQKAEELMGEEPEAELWAYYLYLTTLLRTNGSYVNQVEEEVERIYRENPFSWRVAWLLLYLSEEYQKSAEVKWQFLKKQFDYGCRSFVIYIEALNLLNQTPALLRGIGSFELQVLYYGVKQDALLWEAAEQLLFLVGRVRKFHPVLYNILQGLYAKKQDVRVLQEICILLMKGRKVGSSYFEWYRKGVEKQLPINQIYEYYMMSLDLDSPNQLPKAVLLYFSYQNSLDYKHLAFLYDYVLENRQKLGDLYDTYKPQIEQFVREQVRKGHINSYLARLYQHFLKPETVDEQMAPPLAKLLFAHTLQVEDLRLKKVFVYHPNHLKPQEYNLSEGYCRIALYGSEYTLVFEDAWKNRFVKNVEYKLEKIMSPGELAQKTAVYVEDSSELNLYLLEAEHGMEELNAGNVEYAVRLADSENVAMKLRRELNFRLIQYFFETDNMEAFDYALAEIAPEIFPVNERAEILKLMVLRGHYRTACEWIEKFGPYFVELSTLVRLLNNMLDRELPEEKPIFSAVAFYVFKRGKYNHVILEYLCRYFQGMTKEMRDIWKTARDFEVNRYELAEKILVQMLYSGAFVGEKMEIFGYYVSQGAKQEVETAFLMQCAYDFYVRERVTDGFIFREIQNMYQRGEKVRKVCKLAYLKYYAENPKEFTEQNRQIAEEWLQEMTKEGIHLNFFRELKGCGHLIQDMADKTIIEYRAHPGSRARIHYMILHENGEADEYLSEYMKDTAGGVFYKEFVLFFGETLQYYIMEEYNGREMLTESSMMQKNVADTDGQDTKYGMINDMMISKNLQDYDMLDETLELYYLREYYNEQLFVLE